MPELYHARLSVLKKQHAIAVIYKFQAQLRTTQQECYAILLLFVNREASFLLGIVGPRLREATEALKLLEHERSLLIPSLLTASLLFFSSSYDFWARSVLWLVTQNNSLRTHLARKSYSRERVREECE